MTENNHSDRESRPEQAERFYTQGMELKKQGRMDTALTEFRRAVLSDPHHQKALFEIGLLCKSKAATDKMYWRYSFDAFQKAARLDLNNNQAHDQYIAVGQKMNLLEDLHHEYDAWVKQYPDNELLKRCEKNILTLSMAMMPDQVSVGDGGATKMRKVALFTGIGLLILGVLLMISPLIIKKFVPGLSAESAKGIMRVGMSCFVLGIGGFFVRAAIK